jgi:hypothetical protein
MNDVTNDQATGRVHWSFWVIGVIALLWNIGGVANFIVQLMNADMLDSYRESERAIIEGRPMWATVAFAVAVFGGAFGCLLLLLRKSAAFYVFVASLLGVIVTMIHSLGLGIDFGLAEIIGIILMPLVLAVFLIWYSKYADRKGWVSQ